MQQGHHSSEAGLALTYSISQRLHAVAFVATAGGAGLARGALWVSVSSKVEMYANCRAEERSEVQLPHKVGYRSSAEDGGGFVRLLAQHCCAMFISRHG